MSEAGALAALAGHDADAGLPFDADALESRVVWIWGSPRSGSSWLLNQLCYPLAADSEAPIGFQVPESPPAGATYDAVPVDESFIANHLAPALADPREVGGVYLPGTINNYLSDKPSYAYSQAYRSVWAPEARRFALLRLYAVLARAERLGVPLRPDPLIVIKEVNGSHAADLVMGVMPRSRLLFLIRDGRDIVDSLLHAYQPGGFLARRQGQSFETPEQRLEGAGWAARLWACNVDMTLEAIESHPAELSLTLRYEDLLTETEPRIRALQEWLELERSADERKQMLAATEFAAIPAGMRGGTTRNRAARPGLWRENLSEQEQALCREIMGARLDRFGYETD